MPAPDPSAIDPAADTWLFGYGSLIWRPGFDFAESCRAHVAGWQRRFWQGSQDHRGTPEAPGRVVTLIPDASSHCVGVAFRLEPPVSRHVLPALDHREKNGYQRTWLRVRLADGRHVPGLTWIATASNPAWLGPADLPELAAHIQRSHGPSGSNPDYVLALARALRDLGADDRHVFDLERALLDLARAERGH